jgi:pimeloyl-ACP methyl ester carboxylesterase
MTMRKAKQLASHLHSWRENTRKEKALILFFTHNYFSMRGLNFLSILLASINTDKPQKFSDLANRFDGVYEKLSQAPIYKNYSPTIRFSFVPPHEFSEKSFSIENHDPAFFETVAESHGPDKPLAVYLPGLDCFGISGQMQFNDMSRIFELWRMSVTTDDRTSFRDLTKAVVNFVEEVATSTRPVVLIGESFGGMLAPVVALSLQARKRTTLQGLVMVNPATSFDATNWDQLAPLLSSLKVFESVNATGATPYTVVGGITLSALVPDRQQLQAIVETLLGVPINRIGTVSELADAINQGFGVLGRRLPPDLVRHRVSQWLSVGAQLLTEERLASLQLPTLIVAGQDDNFLPSRQEADRLIKLLPDSRKLLVPGSGHFVLDQRVNLTEAIVYSNIDPLKLRSERRFDPITDWKLPDQEFIQKTIQNLVQPLRRLTSPVFFSTDKNGNRWKGLSKVPSVGPIVFVGNHQLFGLDLGMVVAQLLEDRGVLARGLAHPILFQSPNGEEEVLGQPDNPGLVNKPEESGPMSQSYFRKFGAVKVSPRNYYRLLQTNQNVLLFPGGVREVFHGKEEAYKLFWPETPDFVRTAARFNATIVPISAIGAADSATILLDGSEIANLPFGFGKSIVQRNSNITAARFNQNNADELFIAPFIVPKLPPARHYFVFGRPFSTADIDPRNIEQCGQIYKDVKQELERGLRDILIARKQDPFSGSVRRLAYEQATRKPAPTFPISELNKGL